MPLACEDGCDLIVVHAVARKTEHAISHLHPSRELSYRTDPSPDLEVCHRSAAPDDPDRRALVFAAVEHHFGDETPQQRFALSIGRGRGGPDLREAACEADALALQGLVYPDLSN